jgi:hypothetical protein
MTPECFDAPWKRASSMNLTSRFSNRTRISGSSLTQ